MVAPPSVPHLPIPERALQDFAQRWYVAELLLFGSILREDFGVESDVDVLVDFAPPDNYSLRVLLDMKEELEGLLQRPVDLVVKSVVEQDENPYRRREIVNSARFIYRAVKVWAVAPEGMKAIEDIMRPTHELTAQMSEEEIHAVLDEVLREVRR